MEPSPLLERHWEERRGPVCGLWGFWLRLPRQGNAHVCGSLHNTRSHLHTGGHPWMDALQHTRECIHTQLWCTHTYTHVHRDAPAVYDHAPPALLHVCQTPTRVHSRRVNMSTHMHQDPYTMCPHCGLLTCTHRRAHTHTHAPLLHVRTHAVAVQSPGHVRFFMSPWTAARQASLSFTISQSLLKLMSFESVMPSNDLILYRPLILPSIFPSFRVVSNE